ncbi:MAG: hypothetical protein PHY34_00320 [Patescibacteria group bacterium]|nr:hypothetical protein [Patescibacteria group bacterium]MDD5715923.1 hypothetical protein [Patescibacteria group bacterium]
MPSIITSAFEHATARTFLDGSTRLVITIGNLKIGRGIYRPGWKWSLHAGPQTGKPSERHVGYVISGTMRVQGTDGHEQTIGPETAFEAAPGADAWVVGNEDCVALDFEFIH